MKSKRVFAIGIDGGTFSLIDRWIAEGKLPALASLRKSDSSSVLASTFPPWTPPAWTSIVTGLMPDEHGIIYFHENNPDLLDYRVLNSTDRESPALWDELDRHGLRSVFINIPMTYPVHVTTGSVLISGLGTPPDSVYTSDQETARRIRKLIGRDLIEPAIRDIEGSRRIERIVERVEGFLDDQIKVFTDFAVDPAFDFVSINFRATDILQHALWHLIDESHWAFDSTLAKFGESALLRVYTKCDAVIGTLLSRPECKVIVFSDHGFGPSSQYLFHPNRWLEASGYLGYFMAKQSVGHVAQKRAIAFVRRVASERVRTFFETRARSTTMALLPSERRNIDWKRTSAYVDEYQETLWVNLVNRQSQGIVLQSDFEKLCKDLACELKKVESPLGAPVFESVMLREQCYSGAYANRAGDIVLAPNYDAYVQLRPGYETVTGQSFTKLAPQKLSMVSNITGTHRPEGIFMTNTVDTAKHVCDLYYVVLRALGISQTHSTPVDPREDYVLSEKEQFAIGERLKGLGYID